MITFVFIPEAELHVNRQYKKKKAFSICSYIINTLDVKIEQHMAKEIMWINQLNGMTQTNTIHWIRILQ